jgi:hypothetical protein
MNGDSTKKESTIATRLRTERNLEVKTPTQCMHHGVKLWNGAPRRVKDVKTKFVAI